MFKDKVINNQWVINRKRVRVWCALFHRYHWFSDDWGLGAIDAANNGSFRVLCTKCGDCWCERTE